MSVFKAYDIRGIYPDQIDEALAREVGYHFAGMLDGSSVVIGRDVRPSSVPLAAALALGLREAGADVIDLGLATTPMVYFAVGKLEAAGGVVVTASHNPARYNGLKLCRAGAVPLGQTSGLDVLKRAVEDSPRAPSLAAPKGALRKHDVVAPYRAFLHERAQGLAPVRVAIDAGNGSAGPFVKSLLEGLPIEVVPLYLEPDGMFPNHEANPLKLETLRDLQRAVVEHRCALGVAFDGDGDRCAIVDEQGRPVPGDALTALLARDAIERAGGQGTVLYDLRSTRAVREAIEAAGGKAIETRVGHAFIKALMREHDALFAGEVSGHYYFRECSFAESAFLAMLRALVIASKSGKPFSALVAEVDRYPRTGELNFHVDDKDEVLSRLEWEFADAKEIGRLDGVTFRYPTWWANVRASNTEPLLRLNLEADDMETLTAMRERMVAAIGGREE